VSGIWHATPAATGPITAATVSTRDTAPHRTPGPACWLVATCLCALACAEPRPGIPAADAGSDTRPPGADRAATPGAGGTTGPVAGDAAPPPADVAGLPPTGTAPGDAPVAPAHADAPMAPPGSCVPAWRQPCDACGGLIDCNGACQRLAPGSYGDTCDACGGTIGCGGTCQRKAPANFGMSCNPCGGTIACDGACRPEAQPTVGMICTTCGDTVQCNGQCDGPSYRRQSRMVTLTAENPEDPVAGTSRACPAGFRAFACDVDCRYADGTPCTGCAVGGNTSPDNPGICNCYAAAGTKLPVTCTVNEYLMRIGCMYTGPGPRG
jgi:hypothetical protein